MDRIRSITRLLQTADGAQELGHSWLAETAIALVFEVLDALELEPDDRAL